MLLWLQFSCSSWVLILRQTVLSVLVGWLVEQGLTSHSTQFRSFRRRCFYRSDDPTNSVKALSVLVLVFDLWMSVVLSLQSLFGWLSLYWVHGEHSCFVCLSLSVYLYVCLSVGTPAGKTPGSGLLIGDTPLNLDAAAIQRAAADLPTNVFNTLQQVAGQHTPFQTFQVST